MTGPKMMGILIMAAILFSLGYMGLLKVRTSQAQVGSAPAQPTRVGTIQQAMWEAENPRNH